MKMSNVYSYYSSNYQDSSSLSPNPEQEDHTPNRLKERISVDINSINSPGVVQNNSMFSTEVFKTEHQRDTNDIISDLTVLQSSIAETLHSSITSTPISKHESHYSANSRLRLKHQINLDGLLWRYDTTDYACNSTTPSIYRHSSNDISDEKQHYLSQTAYYGSIKDERNSHTKNRYMYYHPDIQCIQCQSFLDLKLPDITLEELLLKKNYWIDITSPTVDELKVISKVFSIHQLTIENIMSHELREKCDVFPHYIFVCYRGILYENRELQPVTFYSVIFKHFILSFHFNTVPYISYVQQRVKQIQGNVQVVPHWINYALLDGITDSFTPMMQQIETEVDAIDDMILFHRTNQSDMILRIGTCRKKVMQIVRLLGPKLEVLKSLVKRISERVGEEGGMGRIMSDMINEEKQERDKHSDMNSLEKEVRIHPDIALYLGDVQDHILTLLQNLNHYETVLARSESNYLARISIELTQTSNSTNHIIGRLTIFATILLPMNLVTGLWGMNVKVPGKDYDNLIFFFCIILCLVIFAVLALTFARKQKLI